MQKLSTWLRSAALALAVFAISADVSLAQVTVAVNDISGRPGESATVAVDLSGVEGGTAIQSYNLTVGNANGNVELASVDFGPGTLAGDASFSSGVGATLPTTADVTIGGFSTGTNITTSGTLLILTFNFLSTGTDTITLTGTAFNAGDPAVAAGSDLVADVVVSNRFVRASDHAVLTTSPDFTIEITAEDAFTAGDNVISFSFDLDYDPAVLTLGAATTGDINVGWTLNQTGGGATGSVTIGAFFSGIAMTGSGVIARIPATAVAAGTSRLDLNSLVFNAGTPVYGTRDGSVTVTFIPANVVPVASDGAAATHNFEPVGITLTAVDGDAAPSPLTYSVVTDPANGSVSISGNVATYTPDFPFTGTDTFTFKANDGEDDSNTATVTVTSTAEAEATLAGVNEVPFVASPGSGYFNVWVADNTATVTGWFADLQGAFTASHIHAAGVGVNGGVVQDLGAGITVDADGRGGTFSGTFDLATNTALATALWTDGAYANVHSQAYGPGELRGQILAAPNSAPGSTDVRGPTSVTITGNGDDRLYSISWLPATDPDGDDVHYVYQMSANASFTDVVEFEPFLDGNGFRVTVGEAAQLFDLLTNADPGNVNIGGVVTVSHRIITTDGSRWTAGPATTLELERGLVTSNEGESELPTEFALKGNYPNPFNPTTSIQFDLPETADVTVTVTDMLGRAVMTLPVQTLQAGSNRAIQIQAGSLASGLYLYRVEARTAGTTYAKVGTMTLIK